MPYDAMQHGSNADAGFSSGVLNSATPSHQHTLASPVDCDGIGVHSGEQVKMRILPAPENAGIVFIRTDLKNGARTIPASWDKVVDTRLCTVIANEAGGRVATIEHLMAALHACGIDNATIEIDHAEVPVMDGSSDPFIFLIEMAGTVEQSAHRKIIEILSPIEVTHNGKTARLSPAVETRYSCEIAFEQEAIGNQRYEMTLSADNFKNEIGRARTFGFFEEVAALRQQGLARGGSLENAIVIKDNKILNEDGLRYDDEFVRHKLLDAVGDLALAGAVIRGHFEGYCTGHALNNQLLHALFADPTAWRYVAANEAV